MGEDDKTDIKDTPPKFNMEAENDAFQKESPLPKGLIFRFHVKLPGCTYIKQRNTCRDVFYQGIALDCGGFLKFGAGGCGGKPA